MDYTNYDDNTLMRLLAYKHSDALNVLYDRYGRLVFSVAIAIIKDRDAAEEITQDVFLRVWENAAVYNQAKATFKPWLTRIARNRAIDILRKHRTRPEQQALDWAEPSLRDLADSSNPSHAVELQLQQEQVRAALAELPSEQGQALQLAYLQGYTHQEIAQQLEQPLGTVKTRIRLGMQKLRNILQN